MKLVEKTFINHHIEVYQDGEATLIKLIDESGDGGFVDATGTVTRELYTPLVGGLRTACSLKEVLYLLDKLPLAVTVLDANDEPCVVDHFALPDGDEQRRELLAATSRDVRMVERQVHDRDRDRFPPWYHVWKCATEKRTRSLF